MGILSVPAENPDRSRLSRVVIAPHADDEALGCGGLLAKYPGNSRVVVLAKMESERAEELEEARRILGYQEMVCLELPDGAVGDAMPELVRILDRILDTYQPDELFLPFPGLHQDHVAAYEAGMRAARLSMTIDHWFTPTVMAYDVATYGETLYPTELRWNFFESLSELEIDKKVAAVSAYASQHVLSPHPANRLKEGASVVGAARQVAWAEQFALVRAVRGAPT